MPKLYRLIPSLALAAAPLAGQAPRTVIRIYSCASADSVLGPTRVRSSLYALTPSQGFYTLVIENSLDDARQHAAALSMDIQAMDLPVPAFRAAAVAHLIIDHPPEPWPDSVSLQFDNLPPVIRASTPRPMHMGSHVVASMATIGLDAEALRGWALARQVTIGVDKQRWDVARRIPPTVAAAYRAMLCGIGPDNTAGTPPN